MNGFSTYKTTSLLDFRPLLLATRLLSRSSQAKQSKAKQKMDLSLNVFIPEILNNYLAFRHNVGLPSREQDWARRPTHCLGMFILAHRQESAQVLGSCGDVIQNSCSPRKCPSEEELQQTRTPLRPFRSITFYFKISKNCYFANVFGMSWQQGVR